MRADRVPIKDRVAAALRAGEMTPPELGRRLRACPSNLARVLRRLEAEGVVQCVEPAHGFQNASVWALVREQERRAS